MGLQLKPLFGPHFNLVLMTKAVKYILHNLKNYVTLHCFITMPRHRMQIRKLLTFYLNSEPPKTQGLWLEEEDLNNGHFTQCPLKTRNTAVSKAGRER